jgi:GNAT superfamily N-acetyltransferase
LSEVQDLHQIAGRALVDIVGRTAAGRSRLASHGALALSGEDAADLNMMILHGPAAESETFFSEGMALADGANLPVIVVMSGPAEAVGEAARARGLTQAGRIPLMVLREGEAPAPAPCRVEQVQDGRGLEAACGVMSAAFSLDLGAIGRVTAASVEPGSTASVHVAFEGGQPVSAVTVTREQHTAGLWCMATPPAHQRKGHGRALLGEVIGRLRREGVTRFFLFATAAGEPLYRSLGFVTLADAAVWVKGHSTQAPA